MKYLILSSFILLMGGLSLLDVPRALVAKLVSPLSVGFRNTALEIKQVYNFFDKLALLRNENISFQQEISLLREKITRLDALQKENDLLRSQLQILPEIDFKSNLLLASIMGNPNDLSGGSFYIDLGTSSGVTVGAMVIVGKSLVGYVSEVSLVTSKVESIYSPNFHATVISSRSVEGVASGNLGSSVYVSHILSSDIVLNGDIFVTSGKDGKFIPGYVVGFVSSQNVNADALEKSIPLFSNLPLTKLTKVFVVKSL